MVRADFQMHERQAVGNQFWTNFGLMNKICLHKFVSSFVLQYRAM